MKKGAVRRIIWDRSVANQGKISLLDEDNVVFPKGRLTNDVSILFEESKSPRLEPPPQDAVDEALSLLRIAAEVEGALLVQYLYAAYSVLPGLSLSLPDLDHPVVSDNWYDIVREIARQEMG